MEAASSNEQQVSETKLIASLVLFLITLICGYLPVRVILNQNYVQHAMFAGGGVLMATAFCHLIPEAHDSYKLATAGGAIAANSHAHQHAHQQPHISHDHDHAHDLHNHNHNQNNEKSQQLASNLSLSSSSAAAAAAAAASGASLHNGSSPDLLELLAAASHRTANGSSPLASQTQLLQQQAHELGALAAGTHTGDSNSFMAKINGLNVPYLEMTLCGGFFFMYLVEQLMLRFIANHSHEHPCDSAKKQQAAAAASNTGGAATSTSSQLIMVGPAGGGDTAAGDCDSPTTAAANHATLMVDSQPGVPQTSGNMLAGSASSTAGSTSVGNLSTAIMTPSSSSSLRHRANGATELYKFIRGLLIVSAFGTHSIFDGVAIGSQDSVEKVWTIFVAISCHKLIIAAVVGLELFAATLESHLWTLVHLVIFSIMSPIGIILIVVAQGALNISSEHPSMILLQSFATGTLLYIIFVEILQPKEDRYHAKNRLGKSFSLIAGFALMLTVLTLIDH